MSVRGFTIAVFVAIGLAMVVLDVLARRGIVRAPTFGQLVRWAMRKRSAQLAIVMAWWWIGAHFFYG
jgi:hypothetical protein